MDGKILPYTKGGCRIEVVILHILLLSAVINDVWKYQVRNEIIYLGWMHGLCCQIGRHGWEGAGVWLLGMVFPILCLWPLFHFRMAGAGDVKTLSMVGGFFGLQEAKRIMVLSFFMGAVLSIIQVIRYKNLLVRLRYLVNYIASFKNKEKRSPYYVRKRDGEDSVIPFTVAIAVAVVFCTTRH